MIRHDINENVHSRFIGSHCNCHWFHHTPQGRRELQSCICMHMYVCMHVNVCLRYNNYNIVGTCVELFLE